MLGIAKNVKEHQSVNMTNDNNACVVLELTCYCILLVVTRMGSNMDDLTQKSSVGEHSASRGYKKWRRSSAQYRSATQDCTASQVCMCVRERERLL